MLFQNKVYTSAQYGGEMIVRGTYIPMSLTYIGNYVFRCCCAK
jgi:hypothetical protein